MKPLSSNTRFSQSQQWARADRAADRHLNKPILVEQTKSVWIYTFFSFYQLPLCFLMHGETMNKLSHLMKLTFKHQSLVWSVCNSCKYYKNSIFIATNIEILHHIYIYFLMLRFTTFMFVFQYRLFFFAFLIFEKKNLIDSSQSCIVNLHFCMIATRFASNWRATQQKQIINLINV